MKTLCKLSKDVKQNFSEIKNFVSNPEYICMKCGRVSNYENLCDAKSLLDKGRKYKKDKKHSDYSYLLEQKLRSSVI
ncbi:MAG: hypothetical protein SNJ71_07355 [Bacteroidales bacterium]